MLSEGRRDEDENELGLGLAPQHAPHPKSQVPKRAVRIYPPNIIRVASNKNPLSIFNTNISNTSRHSPLFAGVLSNTMTPSPSQFY